MNSSKIVKTILALALTYFLSTISLNAQTLPKEFFGVWRGSRVETINGVTYSGTQMTRITPIQGGRGANMSGSVSFGPVTIVVSGRYSPDGSYFAQGFVNGAQIITSSGTWRMNRRGISASAVTQDITGAAYSGDASLRLAGRRTLNAFGTLSNGGTVSIRLSR